MTYTVEILWENGVNTRELFDVHGSFENAVLDVREHFNLQPWEGVRVYDQSGQLVHADD